MTHWSIGWIRHVELRGKNKISTLEWASKTASPWLLQFSRSKIALNDKFSLARNRLTSGIKDWLNNSLKFIWFTQILFHFQNIGRSSFRFPFSARGFSDRYTNIGLHRYVHSHKTICEPVLGYFETYRFFLIVDQENLWRDLLSEKTCFVAIEYKTSPC